MRNWGIGAGLALAMAASGMVAADDGQTREVQSQDGTFTGEIVGTAPEGSKFAALEIGMSMQDVQELMDRAPDRFHTYESGKRWIPFYFGNDATRLQALFREEGCLIFTGGNVWGGGGSELIQIEIDPTGACYQP